MKPEISGIDGHNVMNCFEALEQKEKWGERLVIIGGGVNGVEFALEQCRKRNKTAVIIEPTGQLAAKGNADFRNYAGQLMEQTPSLSVMLHSVCTSIHDESVTVRTADGNIQEVKADGVIYCTGLKAPSAEAMLSYYELAPICRMIGDCRQPRIIKDAVSDGYHTAMNL